MVLSTFSEQVPRRTTPVRPSHEQATRTGIEKATASTGKITLW